MQTRVSERSGSRRPRLREGDRRSRAHRWPQTPPDTPTNPGELRAPSGFDETLRSAVGLVEPGRLPVRDTALQLLSAQLDVVAALEVLRCAAQFSLEIGRDRARRRTGPAGGCFGSRIARIAHDGRMPLLGWSVTKTARKATQGLRRPQVRASVRSLAVLGAVRSTKWAQVARARV